MPKPEALKRGDTIGIVSPAFYVTPEQIENGVQFLHEIGYKTKTYPTTFAREGDPQHSDLDKARDLRAAFLDPETKAVLCGRGGYGCGRLMPYLDFDELVGTEKLFIGFSDITVIHSSLYQRELPCLYAPMPFTFGRDREPWVYESFANALKGKDSIPPAAPRAITVRGGTAEGIVVGGCLVLICDLIGTPEQIDMTNKIVLIEDIDESPHRVDGLFTHLLNSGCLQRASGIVVGEMTGTNTRADSQVGSKSWEEIVRERLSHVAVPSILNFPFGHCPSMLSLPLGIKAELDASNGTMRYVETLCK